MTKAVEVKTYSDLVKLVEGLKPTNAIDKPIKVTFENVGTENDRVIPSLSVSSPSDGQSMSRKLLLDGFEMVKRQMAFDQAAQVYSDVVDNFGGVYPATPAMDNTRATWLDNYIRSTLGGHREGLVVVWNLPEGKFQLDPWSGKLEKRNA